jgi:ribosomal protein S18 acetylase RimI-like enzyme
VDITHITDPDHAVKALDAIAPVYETVFALPPYFEGPRDVAGFLQGYRHECAMPGFRLVLTHHGDTVTAFAYGYLLQSTTTWWEGFLDTKPEEETAREDGRRTFVIKEIAVLSAYRRKGLARSLHQALLDGVTAERVTLAVRPDAGPALALYAALGYETVGLTRPWEVAPTYRVMLLPLR